MQDDATSTPNGLLNCLHFLADEAAGLSLHQTLLAIHDAIETCRKEFQSSVGLEDAPEPTSWMH